LLFWLAALAIKILGPTPVAATLFSRVFGIGCIILTGLLGSRLFGKSTGWFAGLTLATCYAFCAQHGKTENGFCAHIWSPARHVGIFPRRQTMGTAAFYGGLAVSVLAKSLPGFLPLFLVPLHALFAENFHLL
jgi:4-amino-4-deoxy-L-arabinose transferase-like glycosyltransferase